MYRNHYTDLPAQRYALRRKRRSWAVACRVLFWLAFAIGMLALILLAGQ